MGMKQNNNQTGAKMNSISIRGGFNQATVVVNVGEGVETDRIDVPSGKLTKLRAIVKDHNNGMGTPAKLAKLLKRIFPYSVAVYIVSEVTK